MSGMSHFDWWIQIRSQGPTVACGSVTKYSIDFTSVEKTSRMMLRHAIFNSCPQLTDICK